MCAKEEKRSEGGVREVLGGTFPMFSLKQTSGIILP